MVSDWRVNGSIDGYVLDRSTKDMQIKTEVVSVSYIGLNSLFFYEMVFYVSRSLLVANMSLYLTDKNVF